MNNTIKSVQHIGLDVGRGYVKAYSEFEGIEYEAIFKSIIGLGRYMDFKEYNNPIYIEVDHEDFFIGELAEFEGDNPIQNLRDDKTSKVVKTLIYAALNEIAISDQVKIMLGVPNKLFKKSVLDEVTSEYKNKVIKIKNKITGAHKIVTIRDINIFREADAALMWHVNSHPALRNGAVGLVSVGFRTTELSYYDKGLKFNDKLSKTIEKGNKTALEYVERTLAKKGTMRSLAEIDSSDNYDDLKKTAYEMLSDSVANDIENAWINLNEVAVFVAGGTSLKLNLDYEIVENPQMTTAKGLYLIATKKFCQ